MKSHISPKNRSFPTISVLTGALLVAGCASTSDRIAQGAPAPHEVMLADGALSDSEIHWPSPDWWRAYESSELDRLVLKAERANTDIAMALGRIEQARGRARTAGAALLPALTVEGSAQRSGGQAYTLSSMLGANASLAYEADLWGRYRADRDSARFALLASRFDRDTVRLTVIGDVARNYIALMTVRERRAIAQLNLTIARRLLARVEAMDRVGLALKGDLASQRALVASTEGDLALLDQSESELVAALALLTGEAAQGFSVGGDGLAAIAGLPVAGPGLSSDLLLRRPDIAAAEAGLLSARADVRSARAAMLPRITLTANGGIQGGTGPSTALYNLLGGLTMPILDHGRLAGARDTAEGLRLERQAAYRKTVLTALSEVERDLKAIGALDRGVAAVQTQVQEAGRALAAAEARYQGGVDEIITSLDAQRTLYAARDRLAQLSGDRLAATISLQRTMGGGWSRDASHVMQD